MNILNRWTSRAWSLVAATWLAATLGWYLDRMTSAEWIGCASGLIAVWFGWDRWNKWKPKGDDA